MSKAFTKENDTTNDVDDEQDDDALPAAQKNYVTPDGLHAMQEEWRELKNVERPKVVEVVSWAASNGDRSENGDYIYGKKRLREIDRRLRYLGKRLQSAEVVDPQKQQGLKQVFFGAQVTYAREDDSEHTVKIVGVDEANLDEGKISWLSPVAKTLMKAHEGDTVELRSPGGVEALEIIEVCYPPSKHPYHGH
jgi:transcription elongation factor GreB